MVIGQHILIGIKSSASHCAARILLKDGKEAWKEYLVKFSFLLSSMVKDGMLTQAEHDEVMFYARNKSRAEVKMIQNGSLANVMGHGGSEISVEAQFDHFRAVIEVSVSK